MHDDKREFLSFLSCVEYEESLYSYVLAYFVYLKQIKE